MISKVAIVTVYNACNYGSFLQAYGLQQILSGGGYTVKFLSLPVEEDKIVAPSTVHSSKVKYEKEKYVKLKQDQQNFQVVDTLDESYRCVVVGSDTVWNMFDRVYAEIPYFVGANTGCDRVISYAASVGQSRFSKILLLKGKKLLPIRKNFAAISVRDDKTEKIVHLMGRKCERVIDPTLLCDFPVQKPESDIPDRYVLVYTYGMTENQVTAIKDVAQKKNLKIIATGSLCEWADLNIAVGSFEWLWLVKNASMVITGTFHGTIFSIKYNKQFAVLTDSSDKVKSLLKEFGLSERMCNEQTLEATLQNSIDYERINAILTDRTTQCKIWLLENVEKG